VTRSSPRDDSDTLGRILDWTRERLKVLKAESPRSKLRESPLYARTPSDFRNAFGGVGPRVIAEIKFASPSEGRIHPREPSTKEALAAAAEYLSAGAAALSILTEPRFFQGSPDFLRVVREAQPKAFLLMKDFVVDVYQLELARSIGADAVLLIVAALDKRLEPLLRSAEALGLSALVEVHTEAELALARKAAAKLIGVNSRDLRTLKTDLAVAKRLAAVPPALYTAKGRYTTADAPFLIAESGIKTRADIDALAACGYRGFLVGTHLMKTGTPGKALKELLA